jgi:hypothetical protein
MANRQRRFNPDFALEENSFFWLKAQNTGAHSNALGKNDAIDFRPEGTCQ